MPNVTFLVRRPLSFTANIERIPLKNNSVKLDTVKQPVYVSVTTIAPKSLVYIRTSNKVDRMTMEITRQSCLYTPVINV